MTCVSTPYNSGISCRHRLLGPASQSSNPCRAVQARRCGIQKACFAQGGSADEAKSRSARKQSLPVTNKPPRQTGWQGSSRQESLDLHKQPKYAQQPDASKAPEQEYPGTPFNIQVKYGQQPGTLRASKQDLDNLSSPQDINRYIKSLQKRLASFVRGSQPGPAMLEFCSCLEQVYDTVAPKMDAINISTNLTSLSQLWADAQHNRNFRDHDGQVRSNIEAVFRQSLKQLQPMMHSLEVRGISNIVWSSAKLGLDPNEYGQGMVRILLNRFMQLVRAADKRQRPNAQDVANLVWALATMHHAAATSELLDCVCSYFGSLMQHPHKWLRPRSQDVANVMWAVAELKHSLEDRLLDDLCMYMHSLLQAEDLRSRPDAQQVANMLWALAQLKHAPPGEALSAMLDHLVALCLTPGLQPKPQAISNCFLACAELVHSMHSDQMEVLLQYLLGLHISKLNYQDFSNVAWSLAVMGCLEVSMFDAVLRQLATKHKLLLGEHGTIGTSAQPAIIAARQLHQAVEWLRPAQGSEQMEAWSSLRSRLQAVAPNPIFKPLSFPGQAEFYRALAAQRLQYQTEVLCGVYHAAVLSPHDSSVAKVILVLQRPDAYLTNAPSRLLGRVAFRNKMLGRYGSVVTIPYKHGRGSVESMVGAIKAAVEAKTGLPLDSFRR
ncbi:hypothetical protein ABBQ38_013606 [Trebouxia sp. C0009 RCD-2024]